MPTNEEGTVVAPVERPTVVAPHSLHSTSPTRAELLNALKDLAYYENSPLFWGEDHDFYLNDLSGEKMLLVKYHPKGMVVNEETAGEFFILRMRSIQD